MNAKEFITGIFLMVLAASVAAGSWSGYVVDQTTSVAISGVNASALYSNGTVANSTLTDTAGFFNVTDLAVPENYSLSFTKQGYVSTAFFGPPLTVATPNRFINPAFMNVTMVVAQPANVNGTVSNASGPMVGVPVTIQALQGAVVVNSTVTSNGVYNFSVIDGTYNITASAPGYTPGTAVNNVFNPGENQTVNFLLTSSVFQTGVLVTPVNPSVNTGATQQFTATATYSDNSTVDVTNASTWTSSNATVGNVSATGFFTALAPGSTIVGATFGGFSNASTVTVSTPAPTPPPSGGSGGGSGFVPTPTPVPSPSPSPSATPTTTPSPTPGQPTGVVETQQYTLNVRVNGDTYQLQVSRQLLIEPEPTGGFRSTIVLTIKNLGVTITDFEFKERLPSPFGDPASFEYTPTPNRVVSDGAVWKFSSLASGDLLTLKYSRKGVIPRSYMTLFEAPQVSSTKTGVITTTTVVNQSSVSAPTPVPGGLTGFFTASNTPYVAGVILVLALILASAYYLRGRVAPESKPADGLRGAARLKHEEKLKRLAQETQSKPVKESSGRKELVQKIDRIEQELEALKKQL